MKTDEQIKLAENAIKHLQDYVEIVKVKNKVKTILADDGLTNSILKLVVEIQDICKKL